MRNIAITKSRRCLAAVFALFAGGAILTSGAALAQHNEPAQYPLFLSAAATPTVMFAMSRDHELHFKAYNDYTNLDGGPATMRDTTYRNDFAYYGYFDSQWCYTYEGRGEWDDSNGHFAPSKKAESYKCDGDSWSGNFLNWASMTRIDILRAALYGGSRSTDTATETILERSFLPRESHAFAKVFTGSSGNRVNDFTPYSYDSISLCNVTGVDYNNKRPLIRVAQGAWPNWAHTEALQCEWAQEKTNPDHSDHTVKSQLAELNARVNVCVTDKDDSAERCRIYSQSKKPVGALQRYGADVRYGLVTGSWDKNNSGGVLRKKAGPLVGNTDTNLDEWNTATGVFKHMENSSHPAGIIANIDRFKIVGFENNYTYSQKTDWGNPIGEIYAETLRYLSGTETPTAAFNGGGGPSGLSKIDDWDDPYGTNDSALAGTCANCSVIVLSSGPNSWDSPEGKKVDVTWLGQLGSSDAGITNAIVGSIFSGKNIASVNAKTNAIGTSEFGTNKSFFQGGSNKDSQCNPTTLGGLADVMGVCPESPLTQGSYIVAGLAALAKQEGIGATNRLVTTYAVELSQGLPNLDIPVGERAISIVPVCKSVGNGDLCSLVSVRVENVEQVDGKVVRGSYLLYWEDSPGPVYDYDMDGVQRIEFCVGSYCNALVAGGQSYRGVDKTYKNHANGLKNCNGVGATEVCIISTIPYYNAGNRMYMSYLVSGTASDGLQTTWVTYQGYAGNSINTFDTHDLPANNNDHRFFYAKKFSLGNTVTNRLKTPLYYAVKYGNSGVMGEDGLPEGYYSVNNPAELADRLGKMIGQAAKGVGSATAAIADSARLTDGSAVYQARFNSENWYGELTKYSVDVAGSVLTDTEVVANFPEWENRGIYTTANSQGPIVSFRWDNLSETQQRALIADTSEQTGTARVNWLRGDRSFEGVLRTRRHLLADIVNSSPVLSGRKNARYHRVAGAGASYAAYNPVANALFVGANDGKLHAFDPDTLTELFAYIPRGVYAKLATIMHPEYNSDPENHQYLMDGPLHVSDVYFEGRGWRTLLAGSLGAGARSIFVLDVTDPGAPEVVFDYTSSDQGMAALGFVLGAPQITLLADGSWVVIAGNGYYSGTRPQLLVIDLATKLPRFIDTQQVTANENCLDADKNGLSDPALLPNTDGLIVAAYAGDLCGNLWKFDLTSSNSQPLKLFSAVYINGNNRHPQPITAMPTLGLNSFKNNQVMIYFGTGKYFESADKQPTASVAQSFYALLDDNRLLDKADFHKKEMRQSANSRSITGEKVTSVDTGAVQSAVDWGAVDGWYLDFIAKDANGRVVSSELGEKVIAKAQLVYDRLVFTTLVPGSDPCAPSGHSWLMELIAVGSRSLAYSVFDEAVGNSRLDSPVVSDMLLALGEADLLSVLCSVAGECELLKGNLEAGAKGRMSWKQIF